MVGKVSARLPIMERKPRRTKAGGGLRTPTLYVLQSLDPRREGRLKGLAAWRSRDRVLHQLDGRLPLEFNGCMKTLLIGMMVALLLVGCGEEEETTKVAEEDTATSAPDPETPRPKPLTNRTLPRRFRPCL